MINHLFNMIMTYIYHETNVGSRVDALIISMARDQDVPKTGNAQV